MQKISLVDKNNFHQVSWPTTYWGEKVSRFFQPLMEEGVEKFVQNVQTTLQLIQLEDLILPIAVNQKEYNNSYVVSNYYGTYLLKEKLAKEKPRLLPLVSPFLLPLKGILKLLKINKAVYLNTWFFSASLPPHITPSQMIEVRRFLTEVYPDHLLMFRSITKCFNSSLYEALEQAGFMLVPSREIYFYNPHEKENFSKRVHYHRRRDIRLLEQSGYEVIGNRDFSTEDIKRCKELYKRVYIDKYTPYSPDFSEAFISHLMKHDLLNFLALKKEGRIDAVVAYQCDHQMMQVPFIGYDTELPAEIGLYRMICLLPCLEADKQGLFFHDGHGADTFKTHRGLKKATEYTAIYSAHFRGLRRLPWKMGERMVDLMLE